MTDTQRQRLSETDPETKDATDIPRSHRHQSETDQEERDPTDVSQSGCPECSGNIITDSNHGEQRCEDCGLVLDDEQIDPGPEWRAYTGEEAQERKRTGGPLTHRLHDNGMGTEIGWKNKDASGSNLSARKRYQVNRLRERHKWTKTQGSRERTLKQGLSEIERMGAALSVPKPVREIASVLVRQAIDGEVNIGRAIESVASACLYAATRIDETPRTLDEIDTVSRVEQKRIQRAYINLVRELDLEIKPADPLDHFPRFASQLGISDHAEAEARSFIKRIKAEGLHSGKPPSSVVAVSLYLSCLLNDQPPRQTDIADACNLTTACLRHRYQEVIDAADLEWFTDFDTELDPEYSQ